MLASKRWYLLSAAITALLLFYAWSSLFDHDEIEHLHAAWLVHGGQIPFTDFQEQHHPTLWYLLAPATAWFGSVHALVFAARLVDLGLLAALLVVVARIVRLAYPTEPARFPTLLVAASFMLVQNTIAVRPDPLMNALSYAGIHCWAVFLAGGTRRRALVAGLLFGAAIAVLQKAMVVLALVVFATILLGAVRRERRARLVAGAALMLAGAALPVGVLFLFVATRGYFHDFWFWNYEFNRFFYLQASLSKHFSVWITLGTSLAVDPVLWIAGAAGMFLCGRDLWRERQHPGPHADVRLGLLVVALGYLPYLCANRFPLAQYFIVFLPLLGVFSAEVFVRATAPRPRAWLEGSALLMAAVLAAIVLLYPSSRGQREVSDLVLRETRPSEAVFVPPAYNPIFRPHSGYYWYNGALIGNAYDAYCRAHPECPGHKGEEDEQRWSRSPPAFVYLEVPEYFPYHWSERSEGFVPTAVPKLFRRAER